MLRANVFQVDQPIGGLEANPLSRAAPMLLKAPTASATRTMHPIIILLLLLGLLPTLVLLFSTPHDRSRSVVPQQQQLYATPRQATARLRRPRRSP
mmetsp:Transcript_94076/g.269333  ORF Transcript_94076/g.269333 Transcript_94076/m.269333 type:complete len:96 (-) Transcript_94076:112-399(-)